MNWSRRFPSDSAAVRRHRTGSGYEESHRDDTTYRRSSCLADTAKCKKSQAGVCEAKEPQFVPAVIDTAPPASSLPRRRKARRCYEGEPGASRIGVEMRGISSIQERKSASLSQWNVHSEFNC